MPKLISSKNIGNPPVDGYVLSSSTVGVLEWTDETGGSGGSIGVSSAGVSIVDPATTIDFAGTSGPGVEVTEPNAGIASVVITSDPLTIANL